MRFSHEKKKALGQQIASVLARFFPFMQWLPELKNWKTVRGDVVAGLTVVMLLIPQSLAYAQVAGLPAYYGLYAAFVPTIVGGLFGSSRSLSTGPVAITSLLTGASLQSLAVSGTDGYLLYVTGLAFASGSIQFLFGALRLGMVVNFISVPVLSGFVNAAVLIIALSQLSRLVGIHMPPAEFTYQSFWQLLQDIPSLSHWPSLMMGVLAVAIIWFCEYFFPRWPGVLMAVLCTTLLAWLTNFEHRVEISVKRIISPGVQEIIRNHQAFKNDHLALLEKIDRAEHAVQTLLVQQGKHSDPVAVAIKQLNEAQWTLERRLNRENLDLQAIHRIRLRGVRSKDAEMFYYVEGNISPLYKKEHNLWRIASLQGERLVLQAGGEVVGAMPAGLPAMQGLPLNWDMLQKLLMTALALALIGFMESASIAKRIASDSRERLDMNQELIGQGMAKILGAFFQSMPVSGGFSRSVLNYYSGAKTGFSSVVAGVSIMLILWWLTPLFYYLPIPTLAAVILYTVLKLFDLGAIRRAFIVSRNEGFVAIGTFLLTVLMAPRIEVAVMLGVVLSLLVHLNDTMRTKFSELVRDEKNEFIEADASTPESQFCYLISVVRISGSLYFANAAHFEGQILELIARKPKLRYIIIDAVSMNKIDASALASIKTVLYFLKESGIELWFSRLRGVVKTRMQQEGLLECIGEEHIYRHTRDALACLAQHLGAKHVQDCPLLLSDSGR